MATTARAFVDILWTQVWTVFKKFLVHAFHNGQTITEWSYQSKRKQSFILHSYN